jgi:hypothetical protein
VSQKGPQSTNWFLLGGEFASSWRLQKLGRSVAIRQESR